MSVRLFSRAEWQVRLQSYNFKKKTGVPRLPVGEWWTTPWGIDFVISVEDDGRCDQYTLDRIIIEAMATMPREKSGHVKPANDL